MSKALRKAGLDDKYDLTRSEVFISGVQAVVRLVLMQAARDRQAGLNTAGYVTGYRGSPIGGLDQQMQRASAHLDPANIVFNPGINEDLAATALWGSQQAELAGEGKYDGVFGLWYGKGPGVDRSGDAFRHANHAGTSRHGGVLALMGDDHTCESSTSAHQSEFAFVDAMMPVLNPASVQEIMDYGLYGYALSRFAGVWVGLKCIKDTIESTAVANGDPHRLDIRTPDDFAMPEGGLNIRLHDTALAKEARLHDYKRYAIHAFVRANTLDKVLMAGGKAPRLGIVTTGKSALDVQQALSDLGIDAARAGQLGLSLYKVAVSWPLEPEGVAAFADGLDLLMVVEEKRSLIETQIREQLYGRQGAPVIIGKHDETGKVLFPAKGALEPNSIALAIAERLLNHAPDRELAAAAEVIKARQGRRRNSPPPATRIPWFCSGCPHNSSTRVPEGARAYAGIGCHYMVQWMDRRTQGFTQMGGEGANWVGEAPFSTREHMFQNIGDGTYQHSGLLAIRAAITSGVNITYKILYNDAVAMTGGQMVEGHPGVGQIARQVAAEGARRIVVLSENPDRFGPEERFPAGTIVRHRDYLDAMQQELARVKGVSVLIFDQTCAAEKRRRRKRGLMPDPDTRVIINERLCEGCGDCSVQSNCVSIQPVTTEFGRKRQIHQSSCNKDYTCLDGFCPALVTVSGGRLRKGLAMDAASAGLPPLPEPDLPELTGPFAMVITGIGGTGVVTVGALIGMAAHLERKGCGIIDMAGLAQKGGAVIAHLRLAPAREDITAIRVAAGGADLVLGCDLVVAASNDVLATVRHGHTQMAINSHPAMTANFTNDPDYALPEDRLRTALAAAAGEARLHMIDAGRLATRLLGDSIAANLFLLGFAWQKGLLPISRAALTRAIELNGVAVDMNLRAFEWGRHGAREPERVEELARPRRRPDSPRHLSESLDELIRRREEDLTLYQNAAWARRYRQLVEETRAAEQKVSPGHTGLTEAVARSAHHLMAYKDEYEVARLITDGAFDRQIGHIFDEAPHVDFHFAPPFLARRHPGSGRLRKRRFGPWVRPVLKVLARLKALRGTPFDPFALQADRRAERRMISAHEELVRRLLNGLGPDTMELATKIAAAALEIRGFGPVKTASIHRYRNQIDDFLAQFEAIRQKKA